MSSSRFQNIALLGASGKLGHFLLEALSKEPGFNVTIIARKSSTATYNPDTKVHRVSNAYTREEMISAFQGQDVVIVVLAFSSNADHHRKFIDAAADAKVERFVANHWGSNAELPIVRGNSKRNEELDADIEYLRTKEVSGMSWTALIPGIFFDMAFTYGLLGFDIVKQKAQIWDDGNSSFSASTTEDIAKATVAVLQHPKESRNKYVYTSSFEITQNLLLANVEALSGRKWEVQKVKSADKVKDANRKIEGGAQGIDWLMAQGTLAAAQLFGGEEHQADFESSGRSSNLELGLKKRNLREAVQACFVNLKTNSTPAH